MAAPDQPFRTLAGMRDLLHPETAHRRRLTARFAELAELAGYQEVQPPLVEDLGVFLRVGETTDVVTKEMYDFEDKDGTRVALRPELTAGVARAFVQHHPQTPWKVWYAGANFRHERPQKGRYRSFDQVGVEALGVDDPDLDAEVVTLASMSLAAFGLRRVRLLVNSIGDHDDRARYVEAVRSYLDDRRDDLSEPARATAERNPLRVLDTKRPQDLAVVADAPLLADHRSPASEEHFGRVLAGLDALGVSYELAPRLVRGLDYYRRTTFEFVAEALDAAQNAVGGGGRYDGLVEDLGGPPTDGIGFALGVDRILLALSAEGAPDEVAPSVQVFVVDLTDGAIARDLTHELRAAGIGADRRFGGGSLKSQMKAADRSGARWAVLVGSDEVAAGVVTVRDLRSDAPQSAVPRDGLVAEIRARGTTT